MLPEVRRPGRSARAVQIAERVAALPGLHRRCDVAEALGKSMETISCAGYRHPELRPSQHLDEVYLYTDDDVARLRDYFATSRGGGPPAMFTVAERAERHRKRNRACKYARSARRYLEAGDPHKAQLARAHCAELRRELALERAERERQL